MSSIQTLWYSKVCKILQKLEEFIAKHFLISNLTLSKLKLRKHCYSA